MATSPWRIRAAALALFGAARVAGAGPAGDDAASRYRAMLAADSDVPVACSFTVFSESSERPDEVREERFVAHDDDGRWQLVAVNGEAPSARALDDYAKASGERARRPSTAADFPLADVIDERSVAVAEEDARTITFSFTPTEEGAPEPRKVAGTLVVDKATLRPRRFVVANTETLSPAPTVKMQEFRQEIDFAVDAATGALIFESMRFAVRGRAMVFKKINEEVTLRFSDYDCRT